MMETITTPLAALMILLRALKLPTIARHAEEISQLAEREGWSFVRYLHHLVELEVHERHRRRIERNLRSSELPSDKTLATLNRARRQPARVRLAGSWQDASGLRDRPRADPAWLPRAVRRDLRARPAPARRQARSASRA